MWACPKCGRNFKNTGQRHRCERTSVAAQLENQRDGVLAIHQKIMQAVEKLGPFEISPIRNYIMLKNGGTFLTIKPRKKYLDISFFLTEKTEDFPIFVSRKQSANRTLHGARLETTADVSPHVLQWIKQSYNLISRS
jgi:hypothetical protein